MDQRVFQQTGGNPDFSTDARWNQLRIPLMFTPPDNLLICGTKNTSLWVAAFSLPGAKRWVVEGEEDDVFPCEQAGLSKDGMVVVSGITKVVDKEHVLTKVGVRRLKVD